MSYLVLKHLHVTLAGLALVLYLLRGIWMLRGSALAAHRIVRILPHLVYTLLLVLGATLATLGSQWGESWIWLKLVLLVLFVGVGSFAFSARASLPPARRMSVWGMGIVLYLMIFAVAAHHHALHSGWVPPTTGEPPAPLQSGDGTR